MNMENVEIVQNGIKEVNSPNTSDKEKTDSDADSVSSPDLAKNEGTGNIANNQEGNRETLPKMKKTLKKKKILGNIKRPFAYYKIDVSDIPSHINSISKFMSLHPEFFNTNVNKKMVYIQDNQIQNIYQDPVKFSDTIHGRKGFISTSYTDKIRMCINVRNVSKNNKDCYIKQIEKYVDDQSKNGDSVELYYNKILSDTMIKHCYYKQPMSQWLSDVQTLQSEFFLSGKDYLLSIINNKINNNKIGSITNSWNNLILYGPPGVGKSSFIYRMSMILKLSILSVDLSLYLNKKKDLYALLHGQEFCLPNSNNKEPAQANCIIAFEEFDSAIEKLLDIENIFKHKDILKKEYLVLKNKGLQARTQNLNFEFTKNTTIMDTPEESENETPKPLPIDVDDGGESFMDTLMRQDGIDVRNNRITDNALVDILKQKEFSNEMNSINIELNDIIQAMDEDNKSNILRMADLLELFSPAAPIKGRILIGTTNHLEKMKAAIPALFRAGRLTAVEFTYLDWRSLNQLTQYYFKSDMSPPEFNITTPTSQIIELAIKHVLIKSEFSEFEKELRSLV